MGLFRSRGKKTREKVVAELVLTQQASAVTAQAEAEAERREVTAEARPNPDLPGWGRTLGQQIGRAREDRAAPR
jgi:hypothetical protein